MAKTMDNGAKKQFVDTWGAMGTLWGVNSSVARVHALLMVSENPIGLDDISAELGISRGNASMCLKELRSWGVIEKYHQPGDRRDLYISENDVWTMFIRIARERKRRELDPAVSAVKKVINTIDDSVEGKVKGRFKQMNELMDTLSSMSDAFLKDEEEAKAMLSLLSNMSKGRE